MDTAPRFPYHWQPLSMDRRVAHLHLRLLVLVMQSWGDRLAPSPPAGFGAGIAPTCFGRCAWFGLQRSQPSKPSRQRPATPPQSWLPRAWTGSGRCGMGGAWARSRTNLVQRHQNRHEPPWLDPPNQAHQALKRACRSEVVVSRAMDQAKVLQTHLVFLRHGLGDNLLGDALIVGFVDLADTFALFKGVFEPL